MTTTLHLTVTTPLDIVLDEPAITSLRAEDASGGFGILPGHADFLTVIDAGVLRWTTGTGPWRFCALRGGVFTVAGGHNVRIACREAVQGEDLATLQARVQASHTAALELARRARTHETKLHAAAIRHLMRQFSGTSGSLGLDFEAGS